MSLASIIILLIGLLRGREFLQKSEAEPFWRAGTPGSAIIYEWYAVRLTYLLIAYKTREFCYHLLAQLHYLSYGNMRVGDVEVIQV